LETIERTEVIVTCPLCTNRELVVQARQTVHAIGRLARMRFKGPTLWG